MYKMMPSILCNGILIVLLCKCSKTLQIAHLYDDSPASKDTAFLQRGIVDTQLIAHDKEVYDIAWGGIGVFASVSADGSVRVFDLRSVFEKPFQPTNDWTNWHLPDLLTLD